MRNRQLMKPSHALGAALVMAFCGIPAAHAANSGQDQWLVQQISLTDGSTASREDQGVAGRAGAAVPSKEGKPGNAEAGSVRNPEQDRWLAQQLSLTDGSTSAGR